MLLGWGKVGTYFAVAVKVSSWCSSNYNVRTVEFSLYFCSR